MAATSSLAAATRAGSAMRLPAIGLRYVASAAVQCAKPPTSTVLQQSTASYSPHMAGKQDAHLKAFAEEDYGLWQDGQFTSTTVWATGAPSLWAQGNTGAGIKVAIIDTGVDDGHPDLAGRVVFRKDYVNDGAAPASFNNHGTHCAGIVAANGQLRGVAPDALIYDYRVLNLRGSGANADIADAIRDAADQVDIISMSLGGPGNTRSLHDAVKYAVNEKNVLCVVAAGNERGGRLPTQIAYPAFYSEVVGVGAVDVDHATGKVTAANFSNATREVDCSADGSNVISTVPGNAYASISGTSMACPAVAGFAALLLKKARSYNPGVTETELYSMLKASTVNVPAPEGFREDGENLGVDWLFGAGLITTYPQVPTRAKAGDSWSLPIVSAGAPE